MELEKNSQDFSTEEPSMVSETSETTNQVNQSAKKSLAIYAGSALLVLVTIILVIFLNKSYFKSEQIVGDNLQQYTTDLYTIKHPKSWIAYDVKAVDTELQSILITPQEAVPLIQQSTSSPLKSSYIVIKELEKAGYEYITMGGAYIYVPYVPVEQREEFFEQWIKRLEERSGESLQIDAEIVMVNERLLLLNKYQNEGRIVESATWFAKPDPHGRDKGAETIVVSIEYNAPQDSYNERLLQQLIQSADDSIYAKYLEGVPVPEKVDANGVINSKVVFNSTTSSIVGIAVPRDGQKVLFGDFVGLSLDDFSTVLRVLDTQSDEITALNLSPFTSRLEIDSDAYSDQQVFSPDGTKIILHYNVGIKRPNESLAGQEGFAVFDLETNNLYKLLPTTENKHVSGFRTENGIGAGYANIYGWANNQEIIYTCDTRPKQDRSDSNVIPYDDIFVSFDEVSYCVIDIETQERRVADENEMVLSTYTSEMLEQTTTPFFPSKGPDCVNINSRQCLQVVNGSIYLENSDQTLVVAEGNYRGFLGWKSQTDTYLLINETSINGQESSLLKLNLPLLR